LFKKKREGLREGRGGLSKNAGGGKGEENSEC